MFSENLKTTRKAKGLSQEELAVRIHVVRQTISKWEQGLSVPDADLLIQLAEVLELSVSELLGSKIVLETDQNEVADQLSRINEQLAVRNRRSKFTLKIVLGIVIGIAVLTLLFLVLGMVSARNFQLQTRDEVTVVSEMSLQI